MEKSKSRHHQGMMKPSHTRAGPAKVLQSLMVFTRKHTVQREIRIIALRFYDMKQHGTRYFLGSFTDELSFEASLQQVA